MLKKGESKLKGLRKRENSGGGNFSGMPGFVSRVVGNGYRSFISTKVLWGGGGLGTPKDYLVPNAGSGIYSVIGAQMAPRHRILAIIHL